jgi:hypothetical protein
MKNFNPMKNFKSKTKIYVLSGINLATFLIKFYIPFEKLRLKSYKK